MANDLIQPVYVESQNSVRAFIIRYSFLVYVALTLILGWLPWYLGIQPTQIFFVPFLSALILAPLVGGRKGLGVFLRRMVRIIVGTLIEVGRGKLDPDEVGSILRGRDRRRAGPTAPAGGLTLMRVEY